MNVDGVKMGKELYSVDGANYIYSQDAGWIRTELADNAPTKELDLKPLEGINFLDIVEPDDIFIEESEGYLLLNYYEDSGSFTSFIANELFDSNYALLEGASESEIYFDNIEVTNVAYTMRIDSESYLPYKEIGSSLFSVENPLNNN